MSNQTPHPFTRVPNRNLLRILGVSFGIAVTIGGTIGVGILRTPASVAAQLGNFWLIIALWIFGGIYVLLGTITVAELATSLPRAGGWYVYSRRAFGDYAGFTVGWVNWISYCTGFALIAIVFGEFWAKLIPAHIAYIKVIAIIVIATFTFLNLLGLRLGSRMQKMTGFTTAVAFLVLIVICFLFGKGVFYLNPHQMVPNAPASLLGILAPIVISFQSVIFTYDGWYGAIYFSEEDKDPTRNLPRAMISSVLMIICIYILVNLALLHVLSLPQLATSQLPAADAVQAIFGERSGQIITVLSLFSLLSLLNAVSMMTPRILFGMGRDRLFSAKATLVNRKGTPWVALIVSAVTEIVLIASGTFERLIAITAFFWVIMYSSGFISLLVLRKKEPYSNRPFKAWGYQWTTVTVLSLSIIFLIGVIISDVVNSVYAILLILLSYPIYWLTRKFSKRPEDEATL